MPSLRVLPNNFEAEESVLGACVLNKQALYKASENLTAEDFYNEKNSKIFTVMNELKEENSPIDITTLTSKLQSKGQLNEIGGVEYLTEIVNFVPTSANIDYYIQIVKESSILRKLIDTAQSIAETGYQQTDSINDILDNAERKILNVVRNRSTTEFRTIKDVLAKTETNLERLSENKQEITGLATGWTLFDKITTGLHENELIIIAARPAMGKTAFALNLAVHAAQESNKNVAVFNLEMAAEQLAIRIISSAGQVDVFKLRTGKLENNDWKRVNEAISQLQDTNLVIDDTAGITIGEIRAKCRRLASSDKGLALVIIDYLQLVSGGKNYGSNRQQEVSDISRSLKTLALELNVPIIALSQLSRSVEAREDKRPLMSDLRESGSIEQDADIVAFLYRDDYYNKEKRTDDNNSISELIIGKHRNGPTATINLLFKKNTSTFLNLRKEDETNNDKVE